MDKQTPNKLVQTPESMKNQSDKLKNNPNRTEFKSADNDKRQGGEMKTLNNSVFSERQTQFKDISSGGKEKRKHKPRNTAEQQEYAVQPDNGAGEKILEGISGGSSSEIKLSRDTQYFQNKTEVFKSKLNKLELKSASFEERQKGKLKNVRTLVIYSEYDSASGANKLHARVEKTALSKEEIKRKKSRGILHKLDDKIRTENVGFVYPVFKLQGGVELRSKDIPAKLREFKSFAGLKENALAAENAVLNFADASKTIVKPINSILKNKAYNEVFKCSQESTGLKAALSVEGGVKFAYSTIKAWKTGKQRYKAEKTEFELSKKQEKLKSKIQKYDFKCTIQQEKEAFVKSDGGAAASRSQKKKAWKKVFDGRNEKTYIAKPEKGGNIQLNSKEKRLADKEFKNAKKLYKSKTVKEAYFNSITGKVKTRNIRVVDTSQSKRKKPKKPDSLTALIAKGGLGKAKDLAVSKMAVSDDSGAQAVGKGLQFTSDEISRIKRNNAKKSKLQMEKKTEKYRMNMETAHNKLQFAQSKPKNTAAQNKNNSSVKKAQKKSAQKKQNTKIFKNRQAKKKAASAVKSSGKTITSGIAKVAGKGAKYAAMGILGGIVIIILPVMLICSMLGGGGGGALGGAVGVSVYPQDNLTLTNTEIAFNNAVESYIGAQARYVYQLSVDNGQTASAGNNWTNVEYKFNRTSCSTEYDIYELLSYLSAKHRDNWENIDAYLSSLVSLIYTMEETVNVSNQLFEIRDPDTDEVLQSTTITTITHTYTIVKNPQYNSIDDIAKEQLKDLYLDKDGNSNAIKHYDYLMKGEGGHQAIGTPLPDVPGWNKNCSNYADTPGQTDPMDNCLGLKCDSGINVTAGESGVITNKSRTDDYVSVTVEYEDFIITYYGGSGADISGIAVGTAVEDGTVLFVTDDKAKGYRVQISAFEKSSNAYINPALILEGRQGQIEENQEQQESEINQAMNNS